MITVAALSPAEESEYLAFLLRDPRTTIYSTLEYRDFLERAVGGAPHYYLAFDAGGSIVGCLPCFQLTVSGLGKVINSLPWYGSHGGCVIASGAGPGVRAALLERFSALVAAPDVLTATIILSRDEEQHKPLYESFVRPEATDARIGQVTRLPNDGPDLDADLDAVLQRKTRNLARKARRQGFELSVHDDEEAWQFLHHTHVENMAALGARPKPWSHFMAMRAAIPADWRRLMLARLNGVAVAALLTLRFNQTVEYVTPVIKHEFRSLQPLSFLIWHGMFDAAREGFRWWNWGGTWASQKSLHHFKAGWGADDQPYSYLIKCSAAALAALRRDRVLAEAFPFYFLYPIHQLE